MDAMDTSESYPPSINLNSNSTGPGKLPSLHLWYMHDNQVKKTTLEEVNLSEITVKSLKEIAVHGKPEESFTNNVDEIDVLYNGRILREEAGISLEVSNVKPHSVVHIIKKLGLLSGRKKDAYETFKKEPLKVISKETITELAIALKTMILSPTFFSAIDKLSDPQILRSVFAVVPSLKYDPIGISIIQDPSMILYLADEESLKTLATTRPWLVEAFNFIAATIHQQEAAGTTTAQPTTSSRTPGLHSLLSYMRQIDDDDDDEGPMAGPAGGMGGGAGGGIGGANPRQITRQQLVAALESFTNMRGAASNMTGAGRAGNPPRHSNSSSTPRLSTQLDPFRLFSSGSPAAATPAAVSTPRPTSEPAPTTPSPTVGGSFPGSVNLPPPLSGEMVARAMREAISQLPPDQRAAQMSAIRNLALSLNQSQNPSQSQSDHLLTSTQVQQPPPPRPAAPVPTQQPGPVSSNPFAQQYQDQLSQMRDVGIFDERLSILALRVSDGDVATAVELIFSGWQGEGID